MEIPFDSILDMEFKNAAPGSGLALFVLSQPPAFYLENVSSPRPDGSLIRQWKRCADWTEGQQATKVLRHELIGSAVQLAHVLRNLRANTPGPDIRLRSPSYPRPPESPQTPLDLPQPPLTAPRSSDFQTLGRKRSYSGPPIMSPDLPPDGSGFSSIDTGPRKVLTHGPPSATFPPSPYPQVQGAHRIESSSHYTSSIFPDYSAPESQPHFALPRDSLARYAPPQQVSARAFTVQSLTRDFYDEVSAAPPVSPYPLDASQHHASLHQPPFTESPSPPLDVQYGQQGLSIDCTTSPHELDAPGAIISNLSRVSYDNESVLYPGRGTGLTHL
jgi:regulatory protein PHO2